MPLSVDELRTRPTIDIAEAAELLGIGRASAYRAAHSGEIPTIRVGQRILVPTAKLLPLLGIDASAPMQSRQPTLPRRPATIAEIVTTHSDAEVRVVRRTDHGTYGVALMLDDGWSDPDHAAEIADFMTERINASIDGPKAYRNRRRDNT